MYFLKRLRNLREDSDLKQAAIAQLLGITIQQYSLYETGRREIPARYLTTLAQFYNTSIDYILELTDVSKPYQYKVRKHNKIA